MNRKKYKILQLWFYEYATVCMHMNLAGVDNVGLVKLQHGMNIQLTKFV
jgi:hypothetical protein